MPGEGVPEGNIWRDDCGRVSAFLFRSSEEFGICFPNFASYVFQAKARPERARIVIEPAGTTTREQLIDQLMRNVVPLLLQANGFQVIHASAILFRNGVFGFCGKSFSGKSTLACALERRSHQVWADDSLLISVDREQVLTLKAPAAELRLRLDSKSFFGQTETVSHASIGEIGDEIEISLPNIPLAPLKGLYLIHRNSDQQQTHSFACKRLDGKSAFNNILPLANYCDLTDISEARRIAEVCLKVAQSVPIYELHYRNGYEYINEVTHEIEKSISNLL